MIIVRPVGSFSPAVFPGCLFFQKIILHLLDNENSAGNKRSINVNSLSRQSNELAVMIKVALQL